MWNFLSRLKRAQDAEARASENFGDAYESGRFTQAELLETKARYDRLIEDLTGQTEGEEEDGEV